MKEKRIVLLAQQGLVEPLGQNGFDALWTFPQAYPLFYDGKEKVPFGKSEFKRRLDSYKDTILRFGTRYFLAEQWFFFNLLNRLERISKRDMSRLWVEFVNDLNRAGIITIIRFYDDPLIFRKRKDALAVTHSFRVAATHSRQMEKVYAGRGQTVIYFPNYVTMDCLGGDVSGDGFKADFDLFFAGTMFFKRRRFFSRLAKRMGDLDFFFGSKDFYYTSRERIDFDVTNKMHLSRIYRNTAININYGAICDLFLNKSWGVGYRVFNVGYCRGFVLSDYRRHLEDLFDIDPDSYSFRTFNECCKKVKLYMDNRNLRDAIADKFHSQVMKRHTLEKRIKQFIHEIEEIER